MNLTKIGVDVTGFPIDHLGYRTFTGVEFDKVNKELENWGSMLNIVNVRGRPISVFKLYKPLKYLNYEITCVEIISPAEGDRKFLRKLEHAEFVAPSLRDMLNNNPEVEFITANFQNPVNPELILNFPNDANCKFHEKPLEDMIGLL